LSIEEINKLIHEAEHYRVKDHKFIAMNALDHSLYRLKNALQNDDINLSCHY